MIKMFKKGQAPVYIGLAVVFLSVFMLFFIFDSLEKLATRCETESMPICNHFTGLTQSMLIVLLIIGSFFMIVATTVYIILSTVLSI